MVALSVTVGGTGRLVQLRGVTGGGGWAHWRSLAGGVGGTAEGSNRAGIFSEGITGRSSTAGLRRERAARRGGGELGGGEITGGQQGPRCGIDGEELGNGKALARRCSDVAGWSLPELGWSGVGNPSGGRLGVAEWEKLERWSVDGRDGGVGWRVSLPEMREMGGGSCDDGDGKWVWSLAGIELGMAAGGDGDGGQWARTEWGGGGRWHGWGFHRR